MPAIRLEAAESCDWLRLDLGKANAVGPAFLDALDAVWGQVDVAPGDGAARPLLVTGAGTAFSAGLELPALVGRPRAEMAAFVARFHRAFLRFACLPRPTLAVLNGHAVAGGAILALACDRRLAARTVPGDKPLRFCLNEAAIGLPFPRSAQAIVEHALGGRAAATEPMLTAELVEADVAQRWGALHDVVAAADLERAALAQAARYAAGSARAAAAIKAALTRDLAALAATDAGDAVFLDAWFSPPTQARLATLVAKLKGG